MYRAATPSKVFHRARLKETVFPLFMSATLLYFGDSIGGGSANVSLKSKEDGSEFGNYSSRNYSNYIHCIVLILCGILRQVVMCRGTVSICTSVCMWESVRQVS